MRERKKVEKKSLEREKKSLAKKRKLERKTEGKNRERKRERKIIFVLKQVFKSFPLS